MKIQISEIRPSPKAIRTTWSEEGLEELAQSIKEHGLIVPIKVRPVNGKYEIVYGHRRIKAMRRAGLKETDAIVEGIDDTSVLVQALIENVQREDMNPIDVAKTLFAIQEETGWSQNEMARKGIMPAKSISKSMALLNESNRVQSLVQEGLPGGHGGGTFAPTGKVTPTHVEVVRESGLDSDYREDVIEKAAKEGLTAEQTRRVAETVKAAPSDQAKKKVLEWEYSPALHDPERVKARANEFGAHDPMYRESEPKADADWRDAPEVKVVIDSIRYVQNEIAPNWIKSKQKMSPEARPFIARMIRSLADFLLKLAEELDAEHG